MIDLIIQMLQISDFYGESELIDIAKGKNKLPLTIKDMRKSKKRNKKWH